jgi:hypothetical protein
MPGVSVEFANRRVGYLVVQKEKRAMLYATFNGARSWIREISLPGDMGITVSATHVIMQTERCHPWNSDTCTQTIVLRAPLSLSPWTKLPQLWTTILNSHTVVYPPRITTFGSYVWEQEVSGSTTWWMSSNGGRTFARQSLKWPQLVSVAGCQVTADSFSDLWADCPTGLEVSFWHSSDGGSKWSAVEQSQFGGTAGGGFAPVSSSVAVLDYGPVLKGKNIVRLTNDGSTATYVGDLRCDLGSMVFDSLNVGIASCTNDYSTFYLEETTDGGAAWVRVDLPSA